MPGATSSLLLLVAMPLVTSSFLLTSGDLVLCRSFSKESLDSHSDRPEKCTRHATVVCITYRVDMW